ncbi:MAG: hypothetical protein HYZ75_10325 [Elusimicrobia bacterium]|nr:hypothetical protein [Elusimicrobiota bacterium]
MARWALLLLAAALAVLLGSSLETGRAHAAGGEFTFRGYINRFITPNADQKNDLAILCADNPKDFAVRGKIFDLRGHFVADMVHTTVGPLGGALGMCDILFGGQFKPQALTWDGRVAGGGVVTSGVYVYRIEAEETAVTGTVVVAR